MDIFRIFDALNDVDQMTPGHRGRPEHRHRRRRGRPLLHRQPLDPAEDLYTLDYYLELAEQIVDAGAHILAIKDMAGLLRPAAAETLVTALRERFDLPVHLHTHDTAGGQLATQLAAVEPGSTPSTCASAPMAGTTSSRRCPRWSPRPTHTERDTGLRSSAVGDLEPYWEAVRAVYAPFESGLPAPTGRVYRHEIPGGQLSNLRQQAIALGLGDRFEADRGHVRGRQRDAGPPGQGHAVVQGGRRPGAAPGRLAAPTRPTSRPNPETFDIPDSVIGFLSGELGDPPGGWPEPFRTKALAGRTVRRASRSSPTRTPRRWPTATAGPSTGCCSRARPRSSSDVADSYGDLSVLHTRDYLYGLRRGTSTPRAGPGVQLSSGSRRSATPTSAGMRTVITHAERADPHRCSA